MAQMPWQSFLIMAANDIMIRQRNVANAAFEERQIADPGADAVLKFNNTTNLPELTPVSTLFANAGAVTATSVNTGTLSASGAALFADGTAAAPSIGWTSDADGTGTGFYRSTANIIAFTTNGTGRGLIDGTALEITSGMAFGWNSSTIGTSKDVVLRRLAPQSLALARVDSATPAGNTFTVGESARPGTDSNVAGGNGKWRPGLGTGTAKSGDAIVETGNSTTTGTAAGTYSTRQYASAKYVDLTENTATLFANIALASGKYMGGQIVCTVTADDATDFQALTSTLQFQAVNKGGTITATISQVDSTTAASTGTLTAAYTAVVNGNSVDFKANAASSLTQTTLRVKWALVMLNSNDVGTVTPQ